MAIIRKIPQTKKQSSYSYKKDRLAQNSKRIDEANNENEFWKIVNDIAKPNVEPTWKLENENETITGDAKVAEELNTFFSNKIAKLKETIDSSTIDDPLTKLRTKMDDRNLFLLLLLVCYSCYSCCLVKVGVALIFSSY